MANEIEIEVVGKSRGLDKIEKEAKQTGKSIGDQMQKGFKEAEQAGDQAGKSIRQSLERAADAGKQAGQGIGDSFTQSLGGLVKGGGILAAGTAIGSTLFAGLQAEWAEDKVGGLIAAQTGAAGSAAEGLGDMAGNLFSNSFGASIEDAGAALTAVFQNDLIDTSGPEEAIERIASKVITVSDVIGEEFNDIARAADQAVKTGLAENVSEALDMITHATQRGLNVSGDLLDTVEEYGTSFRELGLEGAEAFGLLEQAQDGGARNIDIAADALKEFGILAQDTASNASRGFQAIGLDGEKMGRMIAAGGEPARTALEQTLNALRAMPPGIARNSAAVDLFGTKAEDLGDALFSMDLDTAAAQFGEFGGTVEDAARTIADSQSAWDRMGKNFGEGVNAFGEFIDDAANWTRDADIDHAVGQAQELNAALGQLKDSGSTQYFDELKEKYPELADGIDHVIEQNSEYIGSTEEAAAANIDYAGTFDDIIEQQEKLANQYLGLSEASISAQEALADANETAAEFAGEGLNATRTEFDLTTEAGRANQEALNDVAKTTHDVTAAMREEGATAQEVTNYTNGQRDSFIGLAVKMGLSERAANELANALFGIPRKVPVSVQVATSKASAQIANFRRQLDNIPRHIPVGVTFTYSQVVSDRIEGAAQRAARQAGYEHGGIVGTAASGGVRNGSTLINEAGPEAIRLASGSTVMTAGATRAMAERGLLNVDGVIEPDGSVRGMASGGVASGGGWSSGSSQIGGWPAGGGGVVGVQLVADAAADSMTGQFLQQLVRKGVLRLRVDASSRVVAG